MIEDGLHAADEAGNPVKVQPEQLVSMNMWGLPVSFLNELEKGFPEFLDSLKPGDIKAEYLLPKIIDKLVHEGKAKSAFWIHQISGLVLLTKRTSRQL